MKNTYKLIWSDEALTNLKNIIYYLEQSWTNKEITKFSQLLDRKLNLIRKRPLLFAKSNTANGLRKAVLSHQISIYYRVINFDIHIISLFDNRQNPEKLKNR